MSDLCVAYSSPSLPRDGAPTPAVGHTVRMAVAELLLFLAQMVVTRRSEEGARLTRFVSGYFRECARAEPLGARAGGTKLRRAS